METTIDIGMFVQIGLTAVIGIIGYLLKDLYQDIKCLKTEIADMKTKTVLIEQKSESDIRELTKITEMHIKSLSETMEKQSENIAELTKQVTRLTAKIAERQ